MTIRYSVYADIPIGPGLAVDGGGRTLVTTADMTDINRTARGDVGVSEGRAMVDFFAFGPEAGCEVVVGIVTEDANLDTYVGGDAHGIGWRVDTGQILHNGSVVDTVDTGLKGEVFGVHVDFNTSELRFMRGHAHVYTYALPAGTWYYATSIAAGEAGGTKVFHNAGQNDLLLGVSEVDGWFEREATPGRLWISTEPYLAPGDSAQAHTRWEGVIDDQGLMISNRLSFWPMASREQARSIGRLGILDASDRYRTLVTDDWREAPVLVRWIPPGGDVDDAELLGSFIVDEVEVNGDGRKTIILRDTLRELDVPLQRNIFPPNFDVAAYSPLPILLGACRSVPPINVGEVLIGTTPYTGLWIASEGQPVAAVAAVRDRGDLLLKTTDWILTSRRDAVLLVEPPQGKVTIDASSVGTRPVLPGDDVWGGAGAPFSGTVGNPPSGWTVGHTDASADDPYYFEEDTPRVEFPNGAVGTVAFIRLGQIEPGQIYRWDTECFIDPAGARRIALSLGTDPTDFLSQITTTGNGYYQRYITNPFGTPQDVYVIATCDGTTSRVVIADLRLYEVDDSQPGVEPLGLAGVLGELVLRRSKPIRMADAEAIDDATGYAGIGYYTADPSTTIRSAIDRVLDSYCASIWQDDDRSIRIARLVAPEDEDEDFVIDPADLADDLRIIPDRAEGLTKTAWYRPNWEILSRSDLVEDYIEVPESVRQQLTNPGRGKVISGVRLAPAYRHAETAAPVTLLFERREDAQRELDRVCALYRVQRNIYVQPLRRNPGASYWPGGIALFTYDRYGLENGRKLFVLGTQRNAADGQWELVMWG